MPIFVQRAVLLLLCSIGLASADDDSTHPGDTAVGQPQEPEITITHRGKERVEEFKINNRVYMIKVTPAKGYPYYLIDTTGDGTFDARQNGLGPKIVVPQWVLFKWK